MRAAILGGGPGGLYFAISLKLRDPAHEIVVIERNRPGDTFGWGVVLSGETLDNIDDNDPESAAAIRASFAYWDDIAVHFRGTVTRSSGHAFCGIGRKRLLNILQDRARALGVELRFETEVTDLDAYKDYDLVVGADGINSRVRTTYAADFKPDIDTRACKFIWLGTHQKFDDAFTFIFEETEHGWIWVHAYQFDADTATFLVECSEQTWRNFGFDRMNAEQTIAVLEKLFANYLGGNSLMSNAKHLRGSAWLNFNRVLCERWSRGNTVLLGDAAATAHFSIGSGTKLAMESAVALANYIHSEPDLASAFRRYEDERRTEVLRLQSSARNSTEWFEDIERYFHLDPVQFNYSLLTRSQRISHENLRQRDSEWLAGAEKWFEEKATGHRPNAARPPMFVPFRVRGLEIANRVCVSPMAQYRAVDGTPNDWHFVHYAERAKGGAGMVFTEMTCVSAQGRISPGCTGLYSEDHERAWKRLVDFVHAETEAKIAIQIGHSGLKGSTQLGWETPDAPLLDGNWETIGPSCVAWSTDNPAPREMTRADMEAGEGRIRALRRNGRSAPASTGSNCTAPTAICCRPSSRRSPTGAPTNMAAVWKTACAFRSRYFMRCARYGRTKSRSRCASRRMTGWGRTASSRRTRSPFRACWRSTASISSTCRPARLRSTPSRFTAACSRRRSPTASATRSASARWRSAISTTRIMSIRS